MERQVFEFTMLFWENQLHAADKRKQSRTSLKNTTDEVLSDLQVNNRQIDKQ